MPAFGAPFCFGVPLVFPRLRGADEGDAAPPPPSPRATAAATPAWGAGVVVRRPPPASAPPPRPPRARPRPAAPAPGDDEEAGFVEPLEPWSQPPLAAVAAPGTTRPATAPQRHRPPPSPTPPFGGQLRLGADSPGPGAYDVARWPASEASRPACPVRGFVRAGGGGALALAGE